MCQLRQPKGPVGALLHPLPLVSTPIGIDIVGPLPRTSGGQSHILVMLDYAMCYPVAVVLCSTTVPVLARELATIFS